MNYKDALLELENKRDNMQISLGYAQARNEHYLELGRKKFAQNLRKNLSTPSIDVQEKKRVGRPRKAQNTTV